MGAIEIVSPYSDITMTFCQLSHLTSHFFPESCFKKKRQQLQSCTLVFWPGKVSFPVILSFTHFGSHLGNKQSDNIWNINKQSSILQLLHSSLTGLGTEEQIRFPPLLKIVSFDRPYSKTISQTCQLVQKHRYTQIRFTAILVFRNLWLNRATSFSHYNTSLSHFTNNSQNFFVIEFRTFPIEKKSHFRSCNFAFYPCPD